MPEKVPQIPDTADELIEKIDQSRVTPEVQERRMSFVSRLRSAVANEQRLTFTLPKPGEGLIRDLGTKGLGAANIWIANFWMRGADYMQAPGDTDSLPLVSDETFVTEVFPTTLTALGAVLILAANRQRSYDEQMDREREARDRERLTV